MQIAEGIDAKPLKLSSESLAKLNNYLRNEVEHALDERSGMEKKWQDWALQAKSRRKRKGQSSREADIDVGLTGERMQQAKARLMNPIFQQDQLFVCIPRKPMFQDDSDAYEKAIDFMWDRVNAMKLCDEWIEQAMTFPVGVVKVGYEVQTTRMRKWRDVDLGELEMMADDDLAVLKQGKQLFKEEWTEIEERRGSFPYVVPIQDFIFPKSASDVETADWVCHRIWMTKNQIKHGVRQGIYAKETIDKIGSPTSQNENLLSLDENSEEDSTGNQYEILEFYLAWEVRKNEAPIEIIVTMERNSGFIMRAVYNFFHSAVRPFVTYNYKEVIGSIYGVPLTYILEPLHAAYSASVAQELDAASKANEILIIGPVGADARKFFDQNRLKGGYFETHAAATDFKEFRLSQPFTHQPQLRQLLSMHADKESGLSDYSFGIEQIGRPTATGQVQVIEEGKQPLYLLLERFRYSLAKVCKMMLARYRQFEPSGFDIFRDIGTDEFSMRAFQWPEAAFEESVIIETKVSSASMSKQLRKQEMVALLDKMPQLYQQMMGMAQMAAQVGNPLAPVAAMLLNGFQVVVDRFLTEFDIAKKEALNPNLAGVLNYGQMVAQQMAQLQGQAQQLGMQNQQLQMRLAQAMGALPPGGPPMAAPPGGIPGGGPPPGMGGPMPGPGAAGPPPQGPQ